LKIVLTRWTPIPVNQKKLDRDGVGSHTWTHPDLTILPLSLDPYNRDDKHNVYKAQSTLFKEIKEKNQ